MGDVNHKAATSSRMGLRHSGGEIVEVQGGHIVRSTGRKDRHSKVCTAKGPRDRRVRLSAHTAIQFYDVQDRLGYDRPSKAVDWLITKAKSAIDELAELPPWKPTTTTTGKQSYNQEDENNIVTTIDNEKPYIVSDSRGQEVEENPNVNSGFLPPSFFPVGVSSDTPSSSLQFQNYPPDFLSRTGSHSQDLRLSLQSLPEPILLHHQDHQQAAAAAAAQAHQSEPVLFSGTSSLAGFDGSSAGWEQHHHNHQQHHAEMARFQRLVAWNNTGAAAAVTGSGGGTGGGGIGGFLFGNPLPPQSVSSAYGGQNSPFYSERGPLQSNNMPFVRAWIDQPIPTNHHQIPQNFHHQAALFSGFQVPARFQGEEEEHDSIHNKLSSASSDSRH